MPHQSDRSTDGDTAHPAAPKRIATGFTLEFSHHENDKGLHPCIRIAVTLKKTNNPKILTFVARGRPGSLPENDASILNAIGLPANYIFTENSYEIFAAMALRKLSGEHDGWLTREDAARLPSFSRVNTTVETSFNNAIRPGGRKDADKQSKLLYDIRKKYAAVPYAVRLQCEITAENLRGIEESRLDTIKAAIASPPESYAELVSSPRTMVRERTTRRSSEHSLLGATIHREHTEEVVMPAMPEGIDEFSRGIVESISRLRLPPSENDVGQSPKGASFATAFGIAPALIECADLLRRYRASGRDVRAMEYSCKAVREGLFGAVGAKGIDWGASPDLALWSLGYHLNKANQNVVSTVDTCLNFWLTDKLEINWKAMSPMDDGPLQMNAGARAHLLARMIAKGAHFKLLTGFVDAWVEFQRPEPEPEPETADDEDEKKQGEDRKSRDEQLILDVVNKFRSENPEGPELHRVQAEVHHSRELCTVIAMARGKAFRQRIAGTMDRKGLFYHAEVAIAAKALEFLVTLVAAMRDAVR